MAKALMRHEIILPALCWNSTRIDFYAVTIDISVDGIRLRSSSRPTKGEDLMCSIRYVGLLEGQITQTENQDFIVSPRGGRATLNRLASQIVTLSRAQKLPINSFRAGQRIALTQTSVVITPASGPSFIGYVMNVSASGVALRIERQMEVGALIRVGAKLARVVRHIEHGVGAAFLEPFDPNAVHGDMRL